MFVYRVPSSNSWVGRSMARRGGEADKFGNRYEALWIVDAILDLFEGEYIAMEIERVGDEAQGVEFVRTNRSGAKEFHSIKRQHALGNWTVSRLRDAKVLVALLELAKSGADAVFSSGTSATRFEALIQGAKQFDSLELFARRIGDNAELSADFYDRIVPECSRNDGAAYEALRRLAVRVKNETELRRDVERRIRSLLRMESGTPLDPRAVRLLIGDFVMDGLGNPLAAEYYLDALAKHGVVPSRWNGNEAVADLIRGRNRSFISGVNALHINRTRIPRQEATAVLDALLNEKKSAMIEGAAGSGKSSVVAQIIEQLDELGLPCLVVSLDRLNQDTDSSAQAIGTNRGLPDSHAISLGEFAGDRPSVLVIDQLDALSLVSARQQWAWDALYELLDEARDYPDMRLLFACRSFDLEQDSRLRRLVADPDRVERVTVKPLDEQTVRHAIADSGVAYMALSDSQLSILSVPLHLYLFLEASRSEAVDFSAPGDLFDAFWKRKARAVTERLQGPQSLWNSAIADVCKALSDRESLVVDEYALDDHHLSLDAMASEGVLTVHEGQVRFFHESFFDYSFARTFVSSKADGDLTAWLVADQQALFRRSQVRQVLAFLRRDQHDRRRYLKTLAELLNDSRVRFHIKKLVLDWLQSLDDPTAAEWEAVEGANEELGHHVWKGIINSGPWFGVLDGLGKWDEWLTADHETAERAIQLIGMPGVLDAEGERVSRLVEHHRDSSAEWWERSWLIAAAGHGHHGPRMQRLLLDLIAPGENNEPVTERTRRIDLSMTLYRLSEVNPTFAPVVIGAWFDRQTDLADLAASGKMLAGYSVIAIQSHALGQSAESAPGEFVRELYPRIAKLEEQNPIQLLSEPRPSDSGDKQLPEVLIDAMVFEAANHPHELDTVLEGHSLGDSKWSEAAVLRSWSANGRFYADRIVHFLLADPPRRLDFGYDSSRTGHDSFVAISRTAIAAAAPWCSDKSFRDLERAIVFFTPKRERRGRFVGRTELALLRALPERRTAESTRKRLQELERRFPDAQEHGAPRPPQDDTGIRDTASNP